MSNKLTKVFPIFFMAIIVLNHNCFSKARVSEVFKPTTLVVGSKTGDSTGTISISNSQIQQNIISAIALLNGMNVSSEQSSLVVTPITAYLVFKATSSAGILMNVAVELEVHNSSLIFNANNGREVHICNNYGNCSSCAFVKMGNRIITCNCSNQSTGSPQTESGCHHTSTWLH